MNWFAILRPVKDNLQSGVGEIVAVGFGVGVAVGLSVGSSVAMVAVCVSVMVALGSVFGAGWQAAIKMGRKRRYKSHFCHEISFLAGS